MFTIGGGYAMIPLIEREVVNRGWLDKQDFMDLFAMTQSLPGIFAVNISIFVGYKLKKVTGSIVDFTGYRSRIDMEMRSISGIYCFGRYYRRIDLYLLDQRKNETGERRVESEKEDGEIKEK